MPCKLEAFKAIYMGIQYSRLDSRNSAYEDTNFNRLLNAVANQRVYYDPRIKLENVSTKPIVKKRSQFRIKSKTLDCLYENFEVIDTTSNF